MSRCIFPGCETQALGYDTYKGSRVRKASWVDEKAVGFDTKGNDSSRDPKDLKS